MRMIPVNEQDSTAGDDIRSCRSLLLEAADRANNLAQVARRTGISRRRVGYLLSGRRAPTKAEIIALKALIRGEL